MVAMSLNSDFSKFTEEELKAEYSVVLARRNEAERLLGRLESELSIRRGEGNIRKRDAPELGVGWTRNQIRTQNGWVDEPTK
ncbi:hypothetical protein ACQU0X_25875 [Pseudovibrio ascidiaceicola]|uniref:hypothetical protein n=1 Tax=Pseudovibrio ascidiaceicola TaxID=285279 RepID=UPI003D362906